MTRKEAIEKWPEAENERYLAFLATNPENNSIWLFLSFILKMKKLYNKPITNQDDFTDFIWKQIEEK